ncbi:PLP-dependent aminotransferase family protein [Roseibium aggregatum]|uniref:MocR-like pyridoxine biosynthesis transcription factor PdxR n=1 Tax=Roseibium aggregatum TaxID=187304 RepID=UPI001AD94370|nr:PLP-dependent aminotransferase family protein [Roseibium aggregatum]
MTVDKMGEIPLPEQIYRAIRDAVRSAVLRPGTKLPSTRRLAAVLDVSRNTVNAAYGLLLAEGIVSVRPGSAPRITEDLPPEGASVSLSGSPAAPLLSRRGETMAANLRGRGWGHRFGAFQPGAPALDCFPYEEWARCLRRAARLERGADLLYRNFAGVPELQKQLAAHLAVERGVHAEPEQILITSSMQSSLTLVSQALADAGDSAWLEEPGYVGARTAFHMAGLSIHPLPVDGEGADIAKMPAAAAAPRLIYVTPSHQFPLGARMPLARRLALLEAARTGGAVILEDDYDSEFLFSGRPVAALFGLAEEGQVIYLSTFSKSLLPGMRVAYCVVPPALVEPLAQAVRNFGCAANVQAQAALASFMDSGGYRKHLKNIRQIYQARGSLLVETLKERLGNSIEVDRPTGNVQLALTFRQPRDDVALALEMHERGFAVSPLSSYYIGSEKRSGLVVGFAGATEKQIAQGVEALGDLLANKRAG